MSLVNYNSGSTPREFGDAFSEVVVLCLHRSGRRVEDMARVMGTTKATVYRRLNPALNSHWTLDEALAVAGFFGVELLELFTEAEHLKNSLNSAGSVVPPGPAGTTFAEALA